MCLKLNKVICDAILILFQVLLLAWKEHKQIKIVFFSRWQVTHKLMKDLKTEYMVEIKETMGQ